MHCTGLLNKNSGYCETLILTKFNMCFNRSTHSNPNNIPKVDELRRLIRRTDASGESLYHSAHASKDILPKHVEIMDVWMLAWKDRDCKDGPSVDEGIPMKDEELEFDTTEYLT